MDKSLAGRKGEPFTMHVELGKIREFARATKSKNPEYTTGDQPVSPTTFLQTSAFWTTPGSNPWGRATMNWARILHGEQEFIFHGEPPKAGDVLTGQSRIDRIYEKEGKRGGTMQFAVVVTEYRNAAGELVAETVATVIETGQAPPSPPAGGGGKAQEGGQ